MTIITYLRSLHQEAPSPPKTYWLLGHKGVMLLLYTLGFYASLSLVAPQGIFPRLENIGAYKSVSITPTRATCGIPERSAFCQAAQVREDLLTCVQKFCIHECPYRSSTPDYTNLLDMCWKGDVQDHRPGAEPGSTSFVFPNLRDCSVSPSGVNLGPESSFTLTVWLKLEEDDVMTLIEKSTVDRLVFLVTVSQEDVQFHYSVQGGQTRSLSMKTAGHISIGQWTHMALQVYNTSASLFLNGQEEDGTALDTQTLARPVDDITSAGTVWIGTSSNGSNQFIGRMQDFRFYPQTLTNREIEKVFIGRFLYLHSQSTCRCPASHSRVHPLVERYCIPNAANDTTLHKVLRLNQDAHPLHYINDNDIGTTWISSVFPTLELLDKGNTITIDLENGQYQVFYVILQFLNAQPEAVRIQRRTIGSSEWKDWQFLAKNCSYFGMEDNRPLDRPDSVNCLQLPSDMPYSRGNITFSMLTPEPNLRPGYNDFYNSAALQEFVRATHVRIHMHGQYHTQEPTILFRHRYYAVDEITISGRCECHGHAGSCDTSMRPYRCACLPESHTHGANCEHCSPLFNDKPFRAGDQIQAYNCRPCQCYSHASSCHYNASLDPQPNDHFRGGGGVCDNCTHNTTGRNCEQCRSQFYREAGTPLGSKDVCKSCQCNSAGTVNGSFECEPIGGQCKCKRHVSGRHCNQCQHGFYKLQSTLADGCRACSCNTAGTVQPDITCHQDSGQCQCKTNVIGLTCDRCNYGFKFLNHTHPDGCIPCDCDPHSSLHQFCNPFTGQCECKDSMQGLLCDTCVPQFYGPDGSGVCMPCDCSPIGSIPGTSCDPVTGQCKCKPHVEGQRCDLCRDGYHTLERGNSLGCLPCQCETKGTVNGSGVCDKTSGRCACKSNVEGLRCNQCVPHTYNLSSANVTHGCQPCHCDLAGTVPETVCDPGSGQCVCLATRYGRNCGTCKPGFFLSEVGLSDCEVCDCHSVGAVGQVCAAHFGQCVCAHPSVTGRRCDQCQDLFFGFNPGVGRCEPCGCDPVGGFNGSCHPQTGQCLCKPYVTGEKCAGCVEGASHMDPNNYLGCSKDPRQQPPPLGQPLNSTAIELSWRTPDSPNSNALVYTLLRDSEVVHVSHSRFPFGIMFYTDSDLSPYTAYSYQLITSNIRSNTSSAVVNLRTLSAVPERDDLQLALTGRARPTRASFNWTEPLNTTGPVESYTLSSIQDLTGEERIHYTGLQTEASAEELHPFTRYNFSLQACTNGGCSRSESLIVLTAQIPPQQQTAPRITTLGPTQLKVYWEPPALPNGIIIRYELFMQLLNELAGNQPSNPEQRVFLSSGWLDPRPLISSANENALTPPENSSVVSNLQPFSTYRFRVLTVNMAGSAMSEWAVGRTAEGVPEFMTPPQVIPVSSSSLRVSWETPRDKDARGEVTEYRINLQKEQENNPYAPPIITQVLYTGSARERSYTVLGLKPYEQYSFTVTVCNRQGCVSSLPGSGRTLPSAPAGLKAPALMPLNTTAMKISWDAPAELNGPPPVYHVERMDVSFSDAQGPVIRGRRFTGSGYFKFPSSTLPVNTDFTGLQLSFRTRAEEGLILYAISPGEQEEYVALQIHKGRPYFLFDPQASAVALSPRNDGGRRYNDNQWHHLIATRKQAVGTMIVDSQYSGSGSATSGSTIIGQNTGVYIGGIPENFTIFRQDTGSAKLVQQGFAGCLKDVLVQKSSGTSDVWEPLDWDSSVENHETYEGWEGCPAFSEDGAYFLGHGFLKIKPEIFAGGDYFEISFEFKTDQLNALLLFAYDVRGKDFILVELQGGVLFWVLRWGEETAEMSVWVGLSYCDGAWNTLNVLKRGSLVSAGLNDVYEQERKVNGGPLRINSPLYLGGVPSEVLHPALNKHSLLHGFGGCIRDVRFARGPVVSLAAVSSGAVRVNLDGCLSADTSVNCRGNDSILVYTGRDRSADDLTLQPFTEYLYRVMASGERGWTAGPWQRGRSRETVPQSVLPPSRVESVNGSSVEVSWEEPAEVRGVIEKYVLKAYSQERPSSSPISATFPHSQHLTGTLSGLAPFSSYSITLTACTQAGCGESPFATSFSTPQEAPEDVVPPAAISYPNSLYVYWDPPSKPNGIITQYILYKDNAVVYQGNNTYFNITGVGVFTPHKLSLSVCTEAGCTNSTQTTLFTGQLPPTHVEPPALTVLDASSIHIQWAAPMEVNGLLEFYTLYQSAVGEEAAVVYNSSELFEDYTARNLVPGTTYLFQIAACTGGGCTLSDPSVARTEESSPEEVPVPSILPLSPHSFNVSWTPPRKPNGVISSYGLWMDDTLVQNSSLMSFEVGDLSPWSPHRFRVQACTAQGCALGPLVESRTSEMPPVGHMTFDVIIETPRSVRAKWEAPAEPNGNLTYTVLFTGAGQNFSSVETQDTETRELLSTGNVGQWVSIGGLQPYSNYSVLVKACNSQGCVESSPTTVSIPPGAPDGLLPPRLAAATPTSLQVAWAAPARPNAPGPLRYRLQMRTSASTQVHQLMDNDTTIFSHMVTGLKPFTEYHFRLLVSNSHGETYSPWVSLFTAQDKPGSVDPPILSDIQPRNASVSWSPPSQPNGVITHYNIYQNYQLSANVSGNSSDHTLSQLAPYQQYTIQVEACTAAGCSLSAESQSIHTPPAPPEDVPAPKLYSDTPTSVLINWAPPLRSNGELDGYTVQRRLTGVQEIHTVATQLPNKTLTYLDSSAALSPWTTYEYRIVANTRLGGSNSSEWKNVTTRPSRPAGLQPPHVLVLGPESVQVTWSAPLIPNGEIERYEIRMPDLRISNTNVAILNRTISSLVPYTNYNITILACSGGGGHVGGCTESHPTMVTTSPTIPQGLSSLSVVAVSESFLAVSWQMPLRPNGPNIRFELLRRKTQQPLASRPPEDLNLWYNVYAGTKLFHEDKGLSRYTWYEYKLLVHNDVGHSSEEVTTGVTLAGQPLTPTNASIQVLNHTAILVNWSTPTLQDLQGSVELYILTVNSAHYKQTLTLDPSVTSVVISDLQPSTKYKISLTVSNAAHNITSPEVNCTTLDGEPEGVFPPEVVTLNSTVVRVLWAAPLVPNGAITEYSVYLDGRLYETITNESGSLEVVGLLPFTVHNIQVEVCTVYTCIKSNSTQVTTVEDTPADISTPQIQVLNSRSVRLQWTAPGQPNGILGGYDVWRKTLQRCEDLQAQQSFAPQTHCTYLECPADQDFCGPTCYKPEIQICCRGTVHSLKDSHQCCEERYLTTLKDSESVCCGGQFVQPLPKHQCCGGYYVPVQPGEICCPDPVERRVSVGLGDLCCGGSPNLSGAGQICCEGRLYDGYNSQCCGGQLVPAEMICCGDADKGTANYPVTGFACCGEDYINTSTSLCCTGPNGESKVNLLENRTASLKCCWSEVIDQEDECCNGVAFNPLTSVCADRAPARILIPENCRPSAVCPASSAAAAFCGLCDFSPALSICTWVPGEAIDVQHPSPSSTAIDSASTQTSASSSLAQSQLCPSSEELVYGGVANSYSFTDIKLEPYTSYEYRIGAWNSYGRGFSPAYSVTTYEDVPWGVGSPRWSHVGLRDDIIHLEWSTPNKPNGEISHYVILRDGQERYRGTDHSFTDAGGIQPFQEYMYMLRACTAAGCTDSSKVVAVTIQREPEGIGAPVVSPLGPRALRISWAAPAKPNGIIREYYINQSSVGVIHRHIEGKMAYNVTGLQPHTNYSFIIVACTAAGCGASQPSMGHTLEDAPAELWAVPRHIQVNSSAVELYWSQPLKPNGLISRYRLLRDGVVVFSSDGEETSYTDAGLQPNTRYVYELEATTGGGSSLSEGYVIQTSVSSPGRIPQPYNVSLRGPRSIFVAWSPPGVYNSSAPLEYNILLNAGTERPLIRRAGPEHFLLLQGLDPYTEYHIQLQACQPDGCGVGPGVSVRTPEASPLAQDPPVLTAIGAGVIEIRWSPPHKPNGLITKYFIYRQPIGTQEELLVFIWTEGALNFTDASDSLLPFREYEYRVSAQNSKGSASSSWAFARTLEAEPEGMDGPTARPSSAYSILLSWTEPNVPNGVISKYRLVYQKIPKDPTFNSTTITALTVTGSFYQAHIFGLEPYTTYNVRVEAFNGVGQVSSPWVTIQTFEASPSGLANFSVEKREHARALLLHWSEPAFPNGVIKIYNVFNEGNLEFSGLARQFLFRRLEPYTEYTLILEACTEAGCTRTAPQRATTEEAAPASQPAPAVQQLHARSVELHWSPPAQPNGRILQYKVLAVSLEDSSVRSEEDNSLRAKIVFTENNTQAGNFFYNMSGLLPWSKYKFRIRVSNAAGYTDSPWLVVHTRQAPPRGLAVPIVSHIDRKPNELFVSWTPPLEPNGVLLTYRIQRDNIGFHFSFDSSVHNYTDVDLTPYSLYSYAVIACTIAGCVTSTQRQIRTLEDAPANVEKPSVSDITSYTFNVTWAVPSFQNGEIIVYVLKVNDEEVYRGKRLSVQVLDLHPHVSYSIILTACTNGGCTASSPIFAKTREAQPLGMPAPILKVTGPESVEVTWREPQHPNGVITGYELHRKGSLIYTGIDTRYHDFTLLPSIEYSYTITANNSQGAATSPPAVAMTHASAPSGVAPPRLEASGPFSVMVQWDPPARPNGVIITYSLYKRDPAEPNVKRFVFASHHNAFQSQTFSLTELKPYYRYEVRVDACTLLGCAASDWSSVQTLESPPTGQPAPLLDLQTNTKGIQTVFLVSWSPPAERNGKLLFYELYRKQISDTESRSTETLVYRNSSTSCHDDKLQPYTAYKYQVWAVNSAGRISSPWAQGRTGPAPPEGVGPLKFLHIHATSAVVDISPPTKPNGIISLYRVFTLNKDSYQLLSEGTSHQQTLYRLRPFTLYSVGVEACTCFLCCSRSPLSELHTQASAPAQQPPPRPVTITSRSALVEWDIPSEPNGIIESYELHVRSGCPQPLQPVAVSCVIGSAEIKFFGIGRTFNITGLLPYASYELRVVSHNNMGNTVSDWVSVTTMTEPPQFKEAFVVQSNITTMFVDWSGSFSLNGPLREYSLTESNLRIYSGFHSSLHIPRTSDKTFVFQVTCTTDSGSASSPVIKYNTATGTDIAESNSGGKTGLYGAENRFYSELWFIILMAFLGLFLLALLMGLVLRRALSKPPFIRERPPIVPLQRRSTKYPPNDSYLRSSSELCSNHASSALLHPDETMGLTDTKIGGTSTCNSKHSYRASMSVLRVPSQSQLSHAFSQNSLHRSVSQLIDTQDKKSLGGGAWDGDLHGTDSGMFVGDDEFVEAIKSYSSVKKEQTMFTDTHL
ncbi:usherin [Triplophysa dalaica]|uniref:usherin n=1 Tax=Triplophysa dalaica TaxID=1582913 RepID=UPI0024E0260D|nr:usherin [Triplophysa dalaica]